MPNVQHPISRLVRSLLSWFQLNARDLPWRRTRDPYAIWVSEIMLQQTQVKTVIPYWERWIKALPDVRALAKASPERIHKLWEGLGYYTRVRNMQNAARKIVAEHAGIFPPGYDQVLDLPGIGPYTAGAICSIAFNQPAAILDGNVTRVLARIFGIRGMVRDKTIQAKLWSVAEALVHAAAPHSCSTLNQALMELGALICTPRNAQCAECPVCPICAAFKQGLVERLPEMPKRPKITARKFVAFVARKEDELFVRQRPAGVVNAHLWEFPNVEVFPGDGDLHKAVKAAFGTNAVSIQQIANLRHSITRYAISVDVYEVLINERRIKTEGRWLTRTRLQRLPFSSAHKKILGLKPPITELPTCPHPNR